MSIADGQKATAANFNAAFASRTDDTSLAGIVQLLNADAASGSSVTNVQRLLNALASYSGTVVSAAQDVKPLWTNNQYGAADDDLFTRSNVLTGQVSSNESAIDALELNAPTWFKSSFTFGDFSAAATASDISWFSLPSQTILEGIVLKHSTAFSGGSVTALTLSVGVVGQLDKYVYQFDAFQAVGDTVFINIDLKELIDFGSTTDIRIEAVATGDNLDQLTAGAFDIWGQTSTLP
jgi:hypothetical protein